MRVRVHYFSRSQPSPPDLCKVMAPTCAAVNIDGTTIHSCLGIPMQGAMHPLNGEGLRRIQLKFKHTKFILIDEFSMVGLRMLAKIHKRLCEASGNIDELFGGFFVYFFGDLR